MPYIHIYPQPPVERREWIRLSARIERPGGVSQDLWFDVANKWASCICASADAWAIATFFLAARERAELHVHGTVSPTLLRNLEEVSLMWSLWHPGKYFPISLAANHEFEAVSSHPHDAVSCFSGGVDGAFTAYRHHQGICGRQRRHLTAGLLVQGFDIAVEQEEQFTRAALGAAKSLHSLELPLIKMRTNLRELGIEWVDGFGAAMAASLAMLKGRFGAGLIGSDERYDFVAPRGSTPLVDPLFSTAGFRVVHDGAGFSRTQKVQVISAWAESVENLRVCWEGNRPGGNCGRCEKCLRTILNFRAVGAGLPSCFDRDATERDIEGMPVRSHLQLNELVSIFDEAGKNGLRAEPWVRALARRISRARRGPTITQKLRSRLALRNRLRAFNESFHGRKPCAS